MFRYIALATFENWPTTRSISAISWRDGGREIFFLHVQDRDSEIDLKIKDFFFFCHWDYNMRSCFSRECKFLIYLLV